MKCCCSRKYFVANYLKNALKKALFSMGDNVFLAVHIGVQYIFASICCTSFLLLLNIFNLVRVLRIFVMLLAVFSAFFHLLFFFCFTLQWNNIITFSHFPSLLLTLAALHLLIHCWWCLRFCCIGYIYCMFKFNDSHCVLFVEFFAYKMFENFYVLRT